MLTTHDFQKLEEFARELDNHLKKIPEFTAAIRDAKQALDSIRESQEMNYIIEQRRMLNELSLMREQLEKLGAPPIDRYEKDLAELKTKLLSDAWPIALPSESIVSSPSQQEIRSNNILDLFVVEWLDNTRFLDFGCGDGWTTKKCSERRAELSVGYDIQRTWDFNDDSKLLLTTEFEKVEANAPYDIVLLYDVLDHMVGMDQVVMLKKIRTLLSPKGKIYVRNHPWCSPHGGHYYKTLNKAYAHLVFDEVELTRIGGFSSTDATVKTTHPLETYRTWFEESGFEIRSERPTISQVNSFFTSINNLKIRERLEKHWGAEDPFQHMSVHFVDYTLFPKESNKKVF